MTVDKLKTETEEENEGRKGNTILKIAKCICKVNKGIRFEHGGPFKLFLSEISSIGEVFPEILEAGSFDFQDLLVTNLRMQCHHLKYFGNIFKNFIWNSLAVFYHLNMSLSYNFLVLLFCKYQMYYKLLF